MGFFNRECRLETWEAHWDEGFCFCGCSNDIRIDEVEAGINKILDTGDESE